MFTGLIQSVCEVVAIEVGGLGAGRLAIDLGRLADQVHIGDSVAVNGVCLTVTCLEGRICSFDLGPQTLGCTTLAGLRASDLVNVELALKVGDRLGGHIVQGHVDGMGVARTVIQQADCLRVAFAVDHQLRKLMVAKGSVAVDGVSLTISELEPWGFWVTIVPHTASATTLGRVRVGDRVNIELDMLAKVVRQYLAAAVGKGDLTLEGLRAAGFC